VGVYNTAPLFFMEGGQAKGLTIDLLRDVAEREGWRLTFVPGTWDECLGRLRSGEIDLLPNITETVERNREFRFTEEFLFLDWATIYTKKGAPIHTVLDLKGKTIAALRGSVFTEDLKRLLEQFGVQAYIVTKHEYAEVLASVARGDADAGVCPNILGGTLERKSAVTPTDIVFAPTKIRSAVKRGGREDLLPALDRHLADLKAQPGSLFYQLRDKWLGLETMPLLPRWALWAFGLGLAALALLAAFAVSLRVMVQRRTRELAQSENRYRAMVDDQTELVSRLAADGTFRFVNQGFCRFFGKTPEELLGTIWAPVVFEEDLPLVQERLARLNPETPLVVVENRNVNAAGEVRWVQFINRAFFDGQGQLTEIQSIGRDITERKKLEDRLRESELHFRTLANSGQALIWTSTPDKLCNYFNEPWLAFTGRSLEQELGNGWAKGVHPEDFDRCVAVYVAAFDARESFSMEYRLRHKSGEYRWIVDQGTPRYDSQGGFLGYIGHCLDITGRKRADEALQQNQAFIHAVMENLPLGIAVNSVNPDVEFEYVNDNFPRLYRTTREQLARPDGFWEAVYEDPGFRKEMRQRVLDDCASGDPERMYWADVPITRKGEPTTYITARNVPLPEHGLMVSTVWDVTQRQQAEEALLDAKEAAEAANSSKSEFLANMSHELRTPMNGVLGMLQLLMLEELKPSQQHYANNAFESANRLLSLLNDILDFSRIEAGVLAFKDEPFNPADILAATAGVFGHICQRKGLALVIQPEPDLPASLLGDEARIRQIVFNLVGNAVKFTRQGSISIEAWHRAPSGSSPARLYIAVSDTGVGIPESKLDSVFDRFSQADGSYTRQFEGAGLGLAIVRRIVESLGGALCIDSEAGTGTAVVLALPTLVTPADVLAAHNAATAAEPEEAMPLRILLAEDELIGQLGARLILERMGHSVVAVNDGKAAVAAALEQEFDCVLMDIQMPEMDGLEATRILRNTSLPGQRGRLPIIAMTAYALSGDREKFLAAGMDEYIAKPFQQNDLRALLQVVARRQRQGARR